LIDVPEQGDGAHRLWCDLLDLARELPGIWTVIGAQMVALYAWEAEIETRPSQDIDVLANVRLQTTAPQEIARFLVERGYEPEILRGGLAHLFRRDEVGEIDLFVPDGIGDRTPTRTIPPNRTIRIPGGTQALVRSEPVAIRTRDVEGEILRPNLLGAIIVKLRAIDVDDVPNAQRADVALLLGLVEDPDSLARELTRTDRRIVRRHAYFADLEDERWNAFFADDPETVALIYRRLLV
jgi:hypothetical protein